MRRSALRQLRVVALAFALPATVIALLVACSGGDGRRAADQSTFAPAAPRAPDVTPTPRAAAMAAPSVKVAPTASPAQATAPTLAAPVIRPIVTGSSITVGGWSPDGEWLAFWRAPDATTDQTSPAETLHFYSPRTGEMCDCPEVRHATLLTPPRALTWEEGGQVVAWSGATAMWGTPCEGGFAPASEAPPTGEEEALSPGGSYRAATRGQRSGDGRIHASTTFTDARTRRPIQTIDYTHRGGESILGLGGEWVTGSLFLIRETEERGPLLVDLEDGRVVVVMAELFALQQVPSPELGFWAAARSVAGSDVFHIVLGGVARRLQLYHSETGQTEELESRYAFSPTFSPDGRWLLMGGFRGPVGTAFALWARPLDPPGTPARLVAEGDYAASWSPDWTRVALARPGSTFGLPNVTSVYSFPEGRPLNSWATGEYRARPAAWSPDGKRLAMSGNVAGERKYGLFVVEP